MEEIIKEIFKLNLITKEFGITYCLRIDYNFLINSKQYEPTIRVFKKEMRMGENGNWVKNRDLPTDLFKTKPEILGYIKRERMFYENRTK